MAMRAFGEYEALRSVAIVLIAIQIVLAALLFMPSAPRLGLAALLALLFLDFLILIAMFQFPLPTPLRLGMVAAMTILLLVIAANSDPLGLGAVNREVAGGGGRDVEVAHGHALPAEPSDGGGAVGARLNVGGKGIGPIEARLGGVAADGLSISMRVIARDAESLLLDWSVTRRKDVRQCGRITVYSTPDLLMQQIEPIVLRSVLQSTVSGTARCH